MKPHRKHIHHEYVIHEDHWIDPLDFKSVTFSIYDDEGEYLHQEQTLNRAKDWIDAEQAGEHDS
jgi:hypothetical protein